MITLKEYSPEDYPMLAAWWAGHRWQAVPESVLPKLGVVATYSNREAQHEDVPLCAAFLYMDNSVGVCWLEWLVSNPNGSPMEVLRAIRAVIEFMEERAKELGYGVMLTACRQASLVKIYERAGFAKTDEGVTHMLKVIGGN
jgi:hypothetical protein